MSNWNLTLANSFAENLKSYKTSFTKMEIALQEKQRNTLSLKNYGISAQKNAKKAYRPFFRPARWQKLYYSYFFLRFLVRISDAQQLMVILMSKT
jgi:hypothetical protein